MSLANKSERKQTKLKARDDSLRLKNLSLHAPKEIQKASQDQPPKESNELLARIKNLQQLLQQKQTMLRAKDKLIQKKNKQIDSLSQQFGQFKSQLQETRQALSQTQRLNQVVLQHQAKIVKLQKENGSTQLIAKLNSTINKLHSEKEQLAKQMNKNQQHFKEQLDCLQSKVGEWEQSVTQLKSREQRLEREKERLKQALEKLLLQFQTVIGCNQILIQQFK